jgi:hypothetical protein
MESNLVGRGRPAGPAAKEVRDALVLDLTTKHHTRMYLQGEATWRKHTSTALLTSGLSTAT